MKEKLYIIGCSGAALEIACFIMDTKQWDIGGFVELDDHIDFSHAYKSIRDIDYPVIPESKFLAGDYQGEQVVIAIGNPCIRHAMVEKYGNYVQFPNIIHPDVKIYDTSVKFGRGNMFGPDSVFTTNIEIGDFNYFNIGVTIAHNGKVGSYNVFNPYASISGNVIIGDNNLIGANANIIQGVTIGTGVTIGINSTVICNLLKEGSYFGMPARRII